MRCGQCGTTNETNQRFCIECGTRLAVVCGRCATENVPTAKFCGECGTALAHVASAPSTPAGLAAADGPKSERRLVSVLFADLVGFTPFSEERDPEEVRETLTTYFDLSREVIERYGGTVEKFIGDAVMAVWGTPVAHEDDAERAVRAAVELIDAVRGMEGELQARVGVQTGEAAVTLGASRAGDGRGRSGQHAARVQAAADPSTVLVSEATMRAASGAIAFEPAGEYELKGKASPMALWRAMRVVAERGGRGRTDALEAPFVGRDTEFRLLKELFHASSREHHVRMVSIIGQGGIGKSRLAWELEKYLDGLVEPVWWHHGRSPSYGGGITCWALGEMVRGRCGLAEHDDEVTTRARVAETVANFVSEPSDRAWIESALLTLLGVGDMAAPEQLFPAWRSFFEHIAREGTVLMVFEDLQWADPGLLAFIDHVMSWSPDLPICMVTLTRPELLEAKPDWGSGHRATSIALAPLPRESMQALLAGLVPGLPDATRDQIVDRADGIPLYAVETVRMLVNDGRLVLEGGAYRPTGNLAELEAPESLRALVASRLDTLDPDDRALLQSAAVVGHTFSTEALAAVTGVPESSLEARLSNLGRREMLSRRADPRSPERGQFAFAQELLREVAYETLARDDRRIRHLAAARYFESLDADELVGALAAQYQAAHRNARAGPEADALAVQARLSLKGAGERAMSLGSTEQAQGLFEAALELANEPADEADLLSSAAQAAVRAGHAEDGRREPERAIEIYRVMGRRSDMARATAALVNAVLMGGWQLEAAREIARQGVATTTTSVWTRGWPSSSANWRDSRCSSRRTSAWPSPLPIGRSRWPNDSTCARSWPTRSITRGTALSSTGQALEGLGSIEAGGRLAAADGLTHTQVRALLNMSGPLAERDPRAMLEASRRPWTWRARSATATASRWPPDNMAEAARQTGDWDETLDRTEAGGRGQHGRRSAACSRSDGAHPLVPGRRCDRAGRAVIEYVQAQIATGEPVWQRELDLFNGSLALPAGRYADAVRLMSATAREDPFNAALTYAGVPLSQRCSTRTSRPRPMLSKRWSRPARTAPSSSSPSAGPEPASRHSRAASTRRSPASRSCSTSYADWSYRS